MSTIKFQLADHAAVVARVSDLKNRSDDIKARIGPTLKKLWNSERSLHHIPDLSVFQTLRTRFPNFLEVLDIWEASAIASSKTGNPFQSSPILLAGDPGLGKTYFVGEAAKALRIPYFEMSMATASAGFILAGNSSQWADNEVGFVAKSLARSSVANPFFLIYELDKANGRRDNDPLGPLFPLLEHHSAMKFKDESLDIEIDASRIIWLATANDLDDIPAPIKDRMRICQIQMPSPHQMPQVIKSVYHNIRAHQPYGSLLDEEIPEEVIEALSGLTPRKVRQSIEEGAMQVIRADRTGLLLDDIKVKQEGRRRYGFL